MFVRSGAAWSQQAKLTASDGAVFDLFGYSVALAGDTALVGASSDDNVNPLTGTTSSDTGSAYIFRLQQTPEPTCLGCTAANPGQSAKDILIRTGGVPSGVYWIDPDGPGGNAPFQVYCDMTTDGGGWMLAVNSVRNAEAPGTDMDVNAGDVGLNSGHTRNLANMAINTVAQIRFQVEDAGGLGVFHACMNMRYRDPFSPSSPSFRLLPGHTSIGPLQPHFGAPWSWSTCAGAPWYAGPCPGTMPAFLADGLSQGPRRHSSSGVMDRFSIWVRELSVPQMAREITVQHPAGTSLTDNSGTIGFGEVAYGTTSPAKTFTLINSGTEPLLVSGVSLIGAQAGDFAVNTAGMLGSVPVGGSTTFNVTFSPSAAGGRTAVLQIASNDPDENPFDILLAGTGLTGGVVDAGFNAGVDSLIRSLSVQPDGKIVIGGFFNSVGGVARNRLARLGADGTLDAGFNPNANSIVLCTAVQADGKIVVGGQFTAMGGMARNRIARVNADGTLDTGFDPNVDGIILSVVPQSDGKILIGGIFTSVGGTPRNRIARLNPDGTLDASFNPNPSHDVFSVALQMDGKILIGGDFTSVSGTPRNRIARLNADGTLDTGFNPNVLGSVYSLAVQADGNVLVGGSFVSIGGVSRNGLGRVQPNGTLDSSFNPNLTGSVSSMIVQTDGQIVIAGGNLTAVGGVARNHIARLLPDGSLDLGFNPNANSSVAGLALLADGQILAGGNFTSIGGVPRNFFARLSNGPATQSLTIPDAFRVQWARGGTAPETTGARFELSTDGITWTPLGTGTRISGGWELTGISLPASGMVRARALTLGGQFNGSSGLTEQQTAFSGLPVPEIAVELGVGTQLVDSVSTIDFGTVNVGDGFSPPTLTIHSLGDLPLNVTSIETSGGDAGDFVVRLISLPEPLPVALAAGGATGTFEVIFRPTAGGPRSATLKIYSNDADENPFEIALYGLGIANLPPTDVTLGNSVVPENQPAGTLVGLLAAQDPNPDDTHTYTLVVGAGDEDNASFTVVGSELRTATVFDHESRSSYSVRIRATDNEGASVEAAFVIEVEDVNEAPFAANPLADLAGMYGHAFAATFPVDAFADPDFGQTLNYTASGLPPGVGFDGLTRTFSGAPTAIGSFMVTVIATDDGVPALQVSDTFELSIIPAPLSVTANGATRAYGEANPSFTGTLTGVMPGDNLSASYTTPAIVTSPVGPYPIIPTVIDPDGRLGNYTITVNNGTLSVTARPLNVAANPQTKVYGDTDPALTYTADALVIGDSFTGALVRAAGESVGDYAITQGTLTAGGNYTLSFTGAVLEITPALLVATADDASRVFGEPNPEFTGNLDGLKNGDQFPLSFSSSATETSFVGAYPIVPAVSNQDGKLANYTVSLVEGTLSITARALDVTILTPASGFLQTINAGIKFTGYFTPTGNAGAYTAHWIIGSATVPETELVATVGDTTVSDEIQFPTPGVYLVKLRVSDATGMMGETDLVAGELPAYVVIYDPEGGSVTGGGWIWSGPGAFHPTLAEEAGVTGKASFGFVARYLKGANTPSGNTEFQFKAGNLNFKSTSYQWLTVAGARAQYKGWGTINGQDGYAFMLTAVDGALLGNGRPDRFRMKIWEEDTGIVVYDNQAGAGDTTELSDATIVGGGSIVIHKGK